MIAITQPAATNYPHSGTLTLAYTVSDGEGSGVRSFTPKMDGASTGPWPWGISLLSGYTIFLDKMSLGPHTFTVDAVDDLGNATTKAVDFSIIASPALTLSASSLSFGNQLVGTSSPQQAVFLTNTGSANLNIVSVSATGDFAATSQCGNSVGVLGSCTIGVRLTPTSVGSRTGTLTIKDDAPDRL